MSSPELRASLYCALVVGCCGALCCARAGTTAGVQGGTAGAGGSGLGTGVPSAAAGSGSPFRSGSGGVTSGPPNASAAGASGFFAPAGRAGGAGQAGPSGGAGAGGAAANAGHSGGSGGSAGASGAGTSGSRGFETAWPWVSFYGSSGGASVVSKVASTFRVINIDVDPDGGNFTDAEIQTLRANGQNRVISYLNLGSCEMSRSYFSTDPTGHKSCQSSGALTTAYSGYPDEKWANLSNAAYQDLMVNYVAARLAARGVDGFYLDNLEVVEHGASTNNGPCDSQCSQGGLDLVWQLRQKFPDKLIVMQNASSDVTRLGMTHGVAFPSLLDGVSHEEVYSNGGDSGSLAEMKAWRDMHLMVNGRPFWLAVEEYVGACSAGSKSAADAIYASAKADGFNAYVTDASGSQNAPCFW